MSGIFLTLKAWIVQYLSLYWINTLSAGSENLIFYYWYRNCGCSNNKKNCLTLCSDHLREFGVCLLKGCFYVTAFVSVCNNDFEKFVCKKASREGIKFPDRRNEQNMWRTNWMYCMECCLIVRSHLLVLSYAMYALTYLYRFCWMSYRNFESLNRNDPIPITVSSLE
jgi:hypothetical protein